MAPEADARTARDVTASRRVEAEALTASALQHFMANEHDKARKVVDRALDLDPVNRRARELQRWPSTNAVTSTSNSFAITRTP